MTTLSGTQQRVNHAIKPRAGAISPPVRVTPLWDDKAMRPAKDTGIGTALQGKPMIVRGTRAAAEAVAVGWRTAGTSTPLKTKGWSPDYRG